MSDMPLPYYDVEGTHSLSGSIRLAVYVEVESITFGSTEKANLVQALVDYVNGLDDVTCDSAILQHVVSDNVMS